MGFIGGALRAFKGDPKFKVKSNVKNQAIADQITGGLSDLDALGDKQQSAIDAFTQLYQGYTPTASANAAQETGVIDDIYGNKVADELAALRSKQFAARQKAVDLALQHARQQQNAARILSGGGDSSYSRALGLDLANRVNAEALLEQAGQERADYANLLQNRLALTGQRTGIMDALANRSLTPVNLEQTTLGSRLGLLAGLDQLDKSNTFYGLQQKRTGLDKWAEFADAADQGIMNAASLVMSIYSGGMMGGGGAKMTPAPNAGGFGTQFGAAPAPSVASGFNSGLGGFGSLGGYNYGGLNSYNFGGNTSPFIQAPKMSYGL